MINWDDPAARANLMEQLGPHDYNAAFEMHREETVLARVNGYDIRGVGSRFGQLYQVDGTDKAFLRQDEAEAYARGLKAKISLH